MWKKGYKYWSRVTSKRILPEEIHVWGQIKRSMSDGNPNSNSNSLKIQNNPFHKNVTLQSCIAIGLINIEQPHPLICLHRIFHNKKDIKYY